MKKLTGYIVISNGGYGSEFMQGWFPEENHKDFGIHKTVQGAEKERDMMPYGEAKNNRVAKIEIEVS